MSGHWRVLTVEDDPFSLKLLFLPLGLQNYRLDTAAGLASARLLQKPFLPDALADMVREALEEPDEGP